MISKTEPTRPINARVTLSDLAAIDRAAAEDRRKRSDWVRLALRDALAERWWYDPETGQTDPSETNPNG